MAKAVRSFDHCYHCRDSRETIEKTGRHFYNNGLCNKCGCEYYKKRRKEPEVRERVLEQHRAFYYRNRDRILATRAVENRKIKQEVIDNYGGICACCKISQIEFLSIDHINGDGGAHRREIKKPGSQMYFWLKKNNYPSGFRVLCYNCNLSLGFYGYCPHGNVRIGEMSADSEPDLQSG